MMFARLLDIEWFKARHSFAFRITLFFFLGVLLLGFGGSYYFARTQTPTYVQPLSEAISVLNGFGMMLMLVLVVLLTGNEKTWRTERQNVIDGLSRGQYFTGKVLLLILCALILWLTAGITDTIFSALRARLIDSTGSFFAADTVQRFAEMFLYLLLVGGIGLLFANVASSSGAGLALAFVFLLAQMPIMFWLASRGGASQQIASYFPMHVLSSLGTSSNDAEVLAQTTELVRQRGGILPISTATAVALALVYTALFSAGAWLSVSRRDL